MTFRDFRRSDQNAKQGIEFVSQPGVRVSQRRGSLKISNRINYIQFVLQTEEVSRIILLSWKEHGFFARSSYSLFFGCSTPKASQDLPKPKLWWVYHACSVELNIVVFVEVFKLRDVWSEFVIKMYVSRGLPIRLFRRATSQTLSRKTRAAPSVHRHATKTILMEYSLFFCKRAK